jgi:hypothetical protein
MSLEHSSAVLPDVNRVGRRITTKEQDVVIGEVQIDEAQGSSTAIDLEIDGPALVDVPDTVTVLAGNTSAQVQADAGLVEGFTEVVASLPPYDSNLNIDVSSEFC